MKSTKVLRVPKFKEDPKIQETGSTCPKIMEEGAYVPKIIEDGAYVDNEGKNDKTKVWYNQNDEDYALG